MKYKIIMAVVILLVLTISIIASNLLSQGHVGYQQHLESLMPSEEPDLSKINASTYNSLNITEENFSTHLPILTINTGNKEIPGLEPTDNNDLTNTTIMATVKIYDNKNAYNTLKDKPVIETNARIRYRGRSTLFFPKKGYRLKFVNADGTDNSQEVMGMPTSHDWVLNAEYNDYTLIRDYMAYNMASNMMKYAPQTRLCEAFLDDKYIGIYLVITPNTVATNRINITEAKKSDTVISYMIQLTQSDSLKGSQINRLNTFTDYTGIMEDTSAFVVQYPKRKNLTEAQKQYIEDDVSLFEKILYSYDYTDTKIGYKNYIDVDSFINYFILNEFLLNYDAGNASLYIYKDVKGKMNACVWDLNSGFDNYGGYVGQHLLDNEGFLLENRLWFSMFLKDPVFTNMTIARYKELRKTALNTDYLDKYIDDVVKYLGPAIERNYSVWGNVFTTEQYTLVPTGKYASSYTEAINQLKSAIKVRGDWLDQNIDSLKQFSSASATKGYRQ